MAASLRSMVTPSMTPPAKGRVRQVTEPITFRFVGRPWGLSIIFDDIRSLRLDCVLTARREGLVRPRVLPVPQPEQSVEPEARGMSVMEQTEMADLTEAEIVRREENFDRSGAAKVSQPPADRLDRPEFIVRCGDRQDRCGHRG